MSSILTRAEIVVDAVITLAKVHKKKRSCLKGCLCCSKATTEARSSQSVELPDMGISRSSKDVEAGRSSSASNKATTNPIPAFAIGRLSASAPDAPVVTARRRRTEHGGDSDDET